MPNLKECLIAERVKILRRLAAVDLLLNELNDGEPSNNAVAAAGPLAPPAPAVTVLRDPVRPSGLQAAILEVIPKLRMPFGVEEVWKAARQFCTEAKYAAVGQCMCRLAESGVLVRAGRGLYRFGAEPGGPSEKEKAYQSFRQEIKVPANNE
jgi:hypothetical protein